MGVEGLNGGARLEREQADAVVLEGEGERIFLGQGCRIDDSCLIYEESLLCGAWVDVDHVDEAVGGGAHGSPFRDVVGLAPFY